MYDDIMLYTFALRHESLLRWRVIVCHRSWMVTKMIILLCVRIICQKSTRSVFLSWLKYTINNIFIFAWIAASALCSLEMR